MGSIGLPTVLKGCRNLFFNIGQDHLSNGAGNELVVSGVGGDLLERGELHHIMRSTGKLCRKGIPSDPSLKNPMK